MRAGQYILFIGLMLCVLTASAQPMLRFSSPEWNFGVAKEEGGMISHDFTARNVGEYPEVILDVGVTCGCVKPEFTQKPVLPGQETVLKVKFNPAGQSGTVDRVLTVYGTDRQVVARLRVRGCVEPRKRSVEERYPVDAGEGIRLTTNFIPFDLLPHGKSVETRIGMANTSRERRKVRFVGLQTSGFLTIVAPEELGPGEEALVRVAYRIPERSRVYGSVSDRYTMEVDGRRQQLSFQVRGTAVDGKPASADGPVARLSSGVVRLGDVPRGECGTGSFKIVNEGRKALTVRAVELPEGVKCTLNAGAQVPPGEGLTVEVTLDPGRFELGAVAERIRIVTDDPKNPVSPLRVAAVIVDSLR